MRMFPRGRPHDRHARASEGALTVAMEAGEKGAHPVPARLARPLSESPVDHQRRAALLALLTFGAISFAASDAGAQGTGHGQVPAEPANATAPRSQDEKWRARYPQPVLVSDLIGRPLLDQNQGNWGWIDRVVRNRDGELQIVFSRARLGLFRGEMVALPAKTAALLGPFVMVLDLSEDEVRALKPFTPIGTTSVDPASKIEMALTKH